MSGACQKPLRISVIGLPGAVAQSLIAAARSCSGSKAVDFLLADAAAGLAVDVLSPQLPELLAGVDADAVYLWTPLSRRADDVLAAIEAGKHVLCEPPVAADPVQAREVLRRADGAGRVLAVAHWLRFHPGYRCMKDALEDVGRPVFAAVWDCPAPHGQASTHQGQGSPRPDPRPGLHQPAEHLVHALDLAAWLLGAPPDWVFAMRCGVPAENQSTAHEAVWSVQLGFANETLGHVWWSASPAHLALSDSMPNAMLIGTSGTVSLTDEGGLGRDLAVASSSGHAAAPSPTLSAEAVAAQFAHFASCVAGREEPSPEPSWWLSILDAWHACLESVRVGGRVEIANPPAPDHGR